MRYPASEKARDHPNRRDLAPAGQAHARQDRHPQDDLLRLARSVWSWWLRGARRPQAAAKRVWNRIPDEIRDKVIERALEQPELSPREVAVAFTDAEKTFVSEASVYRILKAEAWLHRRPSIHEGSGHVRHPTTAINQLWQTDFTYLKVPAGAGSTCRLCSTTSPDTSSPGSCARQWGADDVTATSSWPCRPRGSIRLAPIGGQGSCLTTVHPTSQTICPNGSRPKACGTPAASPIIR